MAGEKVSAANEVKRMRREAKEAALAHRVMAMPDRRYVVIYADPPWRFEPFSRDTGMDRAPDNHYPTMTVEQIANLPVPELAASDAALFLWATAPMLPQALDVMAAWGFTYRSHLVWRKDRVATGYWVRNLHEILLIGTRGHVPAPAPGDQPVSVYDAAVGDHSAKPPLFRDLITDLFPTVPKLELFARGDAPAGWDFWGNEAKGKAA
jgi:N6-adenosine-specific RNA methylase IME4